MKKNILPALKILVAFTLITGVAYPLIITGVAQALFPYQANGSVLSVKGKIIGSELLGQGFKSDRYFWPRPSACDYATVPSSASNWGPTSDTLKKVIGQRRVAFIKENRLQPDVALPGEMLTASASGLDPHISPEGALLQVNRIAAARNFSSIRKEKLLQLVRQSIEKPQLNVFGEKRVNVLQLNMKLDLLR